ncbi:hypothetical protein [Pseudosulfitobacter pseudonitzschiae]|uniref:hypothetical protein n=1 Tax=Pseudosulfitobacter pseudonitzschiae TaxID=1402135 RepID=UPI003B795F9B
MKINNTTALAVLVLTLAAPAFARGPIDNGEVKGGTVFETTAETLAISQTGPQR